MAFKKTYSKKMTVKKLAKAVKVLSAVELKRIELSTTVAPGLTGSISRLDSIAQGTGPTQRIGNAIKSKYLTIRAQFTPSAASTATMGTMFIVRDNQQISDTQPAVSDVINSLGSNSWITRPNYEHIGRFKVLYKKVFLQDGTNCQYVNKTLNLNHTTRFNGVNTSDIQRNGLYIIFISNQITNVPTFHFVSTVSWIDL